MQATTELERHHQRCVPALARLRMLALDETAEALGYGAVTEMSLLMDEVRAALHTAGRELVDGTAERGPVAKFLACRDVRLENASSAVDAAALLADLSALRRELLRFHALALATQKVQHGVVGRGLGSLRSATRAASMTGSE